MPIIPLVGRRSWGIRGLLVSLYALLTLGGIYGPEKSVRQSRSYFREEASKTFIGEPYHMKRGKRPISIAAR